MAASLVDFGVSRASKVTPGAHFAVHLADLCSHQILAKWRHSGCKPFTPLPAVVSGRSTTRWMGQAPFRIELNQPDCP